MSAELLEQFAAKYIWWKTPSAAVRYPDRVLAQVMNLGTFDDIQLMLKGYDASTLIRVIHQAEPDWFSPRSWHFWHYRLGLSEVGGVPPMPVKTIP